MSDFEQQIVPERYQAVPRTLCFITHGADVLLLRGAPDKRLWPNRYNGVGGHVERDEDVYTAARREIREETGLTVQRLRLRGVLNIPTDQPQTGVLVFVFVARAETRRVRESTEGTLEWIPRHRLAERDLVEDLPLLLPRVLAAAEDAPPFFAHYGQDEHGHLRITFAGE